MPSSSALMFIPLLAFLQTLTGEPVPAAATYSGRANAVHARPLRADAEVVVDGTLDEAQWKQAAMLTGFSQFAPRDGVPAEDSTEVLVWYSPTAIHFGIRAFEPHGAVRADARRPRQDLQRRPRRALLGTFNDGRQASCFGVNPLGVQMDGTLVENNQARGGGSGSSTVGARGARPQPRLRLPVEGAADRVRLRGRGPHPVQEPQVSERRRRRRGGFNVVRDVQHSAREDSWAPARRAERVVPRRSRARSRGSPTCAAASCSTSTRRSRSARRRRPRAGGERGATTRERPRSAATCAGAITQQLHAQRHRQSRLLADRVGRGAGRLRSAAGAVLRREAPLLPRRHRAVRDAEERSSTRAASCSRSRRRSSPARSRGTASRCSPRSTRPSARSTAASIRCSTSLRVQRDVGARRKRRPRLHRSRRRRATPTASPSVDARRRVREGSTACRAVRARAAPATPTTSRTGAPLWHATLQPRTARRSGSRYALDGDRRRLPHARAASSAGAASRTGHRGPAAHLLRPAGRFVETLHLRPSSSTARGVRRARASAATRSRRSCTSTTNCALRGGWSAGASVLVETFGFDPVLYATTTRARRAGARRHRARSPARRASRTSTTSSRSTRRSGSTSPPPRSDLGAATRTSSSGRRRTSVFATST